MTLDTMKILLNGITTSAQMQDLIFENVELFNIFENRLIKYINENDIEKNVWKLQAWLLKGFDLYGSGAVLRAHTC